MRFTSEKLNLYYFSLLCTQTKSTVKMGHQKDQVIIIITAIIADVIAVLFSFVA